MQDVSDLFKNSVIVVLSTNLWVIHVGRNESIKIIKVSGPRYDPSRHHHPLRNDVTDLNP